jgi:hypothetical protein
MMYQRFAMSGEPGAHKQEIGTHSGAPEVSAGRPRKKGSAKYDARRQHALPV